VRARAVLVGLLAVYLVLLVWTVLWKLQAPWTGGTTSVKLVPFVATDASGPSAPAEVVANLLLFVPFGVHLGLLGAGRRWWSAVATTTLVVGSTSVLLEVAQYALAVGRSDTTDVLVNTAGGLAGLALVGVARRVLGPRAPVVLTRWCTAATALVVAALALYLVSPWRPVHVHDVGPLGVPAQVAYSTSTGAWSLQRSA
jgi:glycopeptide antibiotics resistance protein